MRIGYHRDASHFPNISVFRGEMQRRLWAAITYLDIQTSCEVGLPRMIKEGMSDTKPPRHLLDEDFEEHTIVLPPSRPNSEMIPIGYLLVKHRITAIFGKISDQANSTAPISYDEVMKLDKVLKNVYRETPEWLASRSIDDLKLGSLRVKFQKFSIDLCYQKARCILHRKFIVPTKPSFHGYSMSECVDASMRILKLQAFIFHESQLGWSICHQKWTTRDDFLLASMLLCLYLGHSIADGSIKLLPSGSEKWSKEDILEALDGSYKIWDQENQLTQTSKEADKATKALRTMLAKVKGAMVARSSMTFEPTGSQTALINGLDMINSRESILVFWIQPHHDN
jgi:hypothetical protein